MKKLIMALSLLVSTSSLAKEEGNICSGKIDGVEVVMPERQVIEGDGRVLLEFLLAEGAPSLRQYLKTVVDGKVCEPNKCMDGIMAVRQGKAGPVVGVRVRCRTKEPRT